MNTLLLDPSSLTDRRLVELHLDGDRTAFRQIVERHQAMVCALGLSACGDVARSEDLAQEVFVAAWKQLPGLREPEKLRGWLAGITRNLMHNAFRRQQHTPTGRAEPLSPELPAGEAGPREHAIKADEAALMWNALEGIPETYREPMVLFYREQRSVAAVAAALEISEDAVRQRLARGRAMLTERMAKLVEETLERSAPTPAFAGMVILALPFGVTPTVIVAEAGVVGAKVATGSAVSKTTAAAGAVGMAASKGGLAVKALAVLGLLPAVFSGTLEFLRFRTNYEAANSLAKKRQIAVAHLSPKLLLGLFLLSYLGVTAFGRLTGASLEARSLQLLLLLLLLLLAMVWFRRWQKRTEVAEALTEYKVSNTGTVFDEKAFEYRSLRKLLGLPLLHVYVGGPTRVMRRRARGWIAVSDGVAWGGLFAAGGQLAVAPVSLGAGAVGFLSLGFFSFGAWAVGLLAGGVYGCGVFAFGWKAAKGFLAFAREYAMTTVPDGLVAAAHANDAMAQAYFSEHLFFRIADIATGLVNASLLFLWLPALLLIGWYLWRTRRAR